MNGASGDPRLADIGELLAYLEAASIEEASELISGNIEPDAVIFQDDDGEYVLRMDQQGFALEFPMSTEFFWELVHDLESDVISAPDVEIWRESIGGESPTWDSAALHPRNEPRRVAYYRQLQSRYRERVLHAKPGASGRYRALGSYLDADEVAANPGLNFLSEAALAHADERIAAVKAEGGTLDPVRLKRNMLSSMPLCFNLFGTMRAEPASIEVFQELFDPATTRIVDMICEWAPQPPSEYLNDRTAFDAVVFYETAAGPKFCAIETRYTEPFSVTEYANPRYNEVTRQSGWFTNPDRALSELKVRKSNQLWRNVLLAAAVEAGDDRGAGSVAVVALADDPGAHAAVVAVASALADANRLKFVSLETIVDACDSRSSLRDWSAAFRQRYLGPLPS